MKKKAGVLFGIIWVMVFLITVIPHYRSHADNDDFVTGNYTLLVNGSEPSAETQVQDGESVSIIMDWSLRDSENPDTVYTVDLGEKVAGKNIWLADHSNLPVFAQGSDETVGTYSVQDGLMTVSFDEEYVTGLNNKSGGLTVNGEVATDFEEKDHGTAFTIGIADKAYSVLYDAAVPESTLALTKTADDHVTSSGGTVLQGFNGSVTAKTGDVSDLRFTDKADKGLSNLAGLEVTSGADTGIADGTKYDSISDLNNALAGRTLSQGKTFSFHYTMNVDLGDSETAYWNHLTAEYKTNLGNSARTDDKSGWAEASFKAPSVSKEGTVSADGKQVSWKIIVRLNDLYRSSMTSAEARALISSLTDTPGEGVENAGLPVDYTASLTEAEPGVYTYTAVQNITEAVQNSSSKFTLKNKVTATIAGEQYTANASCVTSGKQWLFKAVDDDGYNAATKMITWRVTLGQIPAGVSEVSLYDDTTAAHSRRGLHEITDTVYISEQGGASKTLVVRNGAVVAGNPYVASYDEGSLRLLDSYFENAANIGKSLNIYFQSQITDDKIIGKKFYNVVTMQYTDSLGKAVPQTASAIWESENAVTKSGQRVSGENAVSYTIMADLGKIGFLASGKNLVLTDTLPDGMTIDVDSVTASLKKMYDSFDGDWMETEVTALPLSDGRFQFVIPVTRAMVEAAASADGFDPGVAVTYKAELTPAEISDILKDGKTEDGKKSRTYTNTVSGAYNDVWIGEDSAVNTVSPKKIVTKTAVYSEETSPYIEYTVDVNPDKLRLGNRWIGATDHLGSALGYDLDSIVVKREGTSGWIPMTDDEYECYYVNGKNALEFVLPDETSVRITYRAIVNLYAQNKEKAFNSRLTEENSYNKFTLDDFGASQAGDSVSFDRYALQPSGWADGTLASLLVQKYTVDDENNRRTLSGAKFRLMTCDYDAATDSFINLKTLRDNLSVSDSGTLSLTRLDFDRIYALYEIEAPAGYVREETPYYFVIPGSADSTYSRKVHVYANGATLYFENKRISQAEPSVSPAAPGASSSAGPSGETDPDETVLPADSASPAASAGSADPTVPGTQGAITDGATPGTVQQPAVTSVPPEPSASATVKPKKTPAPKKEGTGSGTGKNKNNSKNSSDKTKKNKTSKSAKYPNVPDTGDAFYNILLLEVVLMIMSGFGMVLLFRCQSKSKRMTATSK